MQTDAAKKGKLYEIKVRWHLGPNRFRAFETLTLTLEASGETTIAARIADQAALFGLMVQIRNLGVPLLSVRCLGCSEGEADDRQEQERGEKEDHDG